MIRALALRYGLWSQDFWLGSGIDQKFQAFYHLMSIQGATRMTQLPQPRRTGSVSHEQW